MDTDTARRRQLVRRRADAKVWGVAAGVADYFGIEAIWVRLGFVLTAFTGGLGVIAYITLRILMPVTDEPSGEPRYGPRDIGAWFSGTTVGIVIIVVGVLVLATQIFERSAGWFWGLALIGLGVWLFRDRDDPAPVAVAPADAGEPLPDPAPIIHAPPTPPRRRRERSGLGALTIGVTLIVFGVMWLLDISGSEFRMVHYFAASLLVLGAGLVLGAWVGRARWLIPLALLLLPLTVLASAITLPLDGGFGRRYIQPDGVSSLSARYEHGVGGLTLNLQRLTVNPRAEPVDVAASVAVGSIDVYLPADMAVDVRSRVGFGAIGHQGIETGWHDLDRVRRYGPSEGPPAIRLDLQVSVGGVSVWAIEQARGADR